MSLEKFTRKKGKEDLLADIVDELLRTKSENQFWFLIGQRLRYGTGKKYQNFDNDLPVNGHYEELEVTDSKDSRRIVVDTNNFEIYPTRTHYRQMFHAGKPNWAN